jgi:hypothetical protein
MKTGAIYWDNSNPNDKDTFTNADIVNVTHTYNTNYAGTIDISILGTNDEFVINNANFTDIEINITEIFKLVQLGTKKFDMTCTVNGDAGPNGLSNTNITLYISKLEYSIINLNYFPTTINVIEVGGDENINGNCDMSGDINLINSYPNLTNIQIGRNNNISGTINTLTPNNNLQIFSIQGNNILEGDLLNIFNNYPNLYYLIINGNNTINGNIFEFSQLLQYIQIEGSSKLTGNKFPEMPNLKTMRLTSELNNFNVNLDTLPAANSIYLVTTGEITGDMGALIKSPNITISAGENTGGVFYTVGTDWSSYTLETWDITLSSGIIDSNTLDNLLIDLANTCTSFAYPSEIIIDGEVTEASSRARSNLRDNYGVDITIRNF